jgi:AhpD family alkylhydroperoxidase
MYMKKLTTIVMVATLCMGTLSAWAEETAHGDVFKEIQAELGFVPEFFKYIPKRTLRDQWNLFKDMFLRADGPLSSKQKELIGLAVAGMKMCDYCIPMHHALARYHGATEEEINGVAQVSRSIGQWSTFLYAINYPVDQFKEDVNRIISHLP